MKRWPFPLLTAIQSLAKSAAKLVYDAAGMFGDYAASEANAKRLEWCIDQIRPQVAVALTAAIAQSLPKLLAWLAPYFGAFGPIVGAVAQMIIESAYQAAKLPAIDETRPTGGTST
jgi:hypothetical protein